MSVGQQLDIRIQESFLLFLSLRWVEVQGDKTVHFLINRSFNARFCVLFLELFSYLLQFCHTI